jgi:hypothetical protein
MLTNICGCTECQAFHGSRLRTVPRASVCGSDIRAAERPEKSAALHSLGLDLVGLVLESHWLFFTLCLPLL